MKINLETKDNAELLTTRLNRVGYVNGNAFETCKACAAEGNILHVLGLFTGTNDTTQWNRMKRMREARLKVQQWMTVWWG